MISFNNNNNNNDNNNNNNNNNLLYLYRIAQLVTLTSLHCGPVVNIYTDIMCRNTLMIMMNIKADVFPAPIKGRARFYASLHLDFHEHL